MVDASSHAGVQFSFGPFGQLKLQVFRTSVKLLTIYIYVNATLSYAINVSRPAGSYDLPERVEMRYSEVLTSTQ